MLNTSDDIETLVLTLNLIQIIKLWCVNLEILFDRNEKKDRRIPRYLYDDYAEFSKNYIFLQDFLKGVYVTYTKTAMKAILEKESIDKVINFCQHIENKLHYVINYHMRMSNRMVDHINPISMPKGGEKELPDKETETNISRRSSKYSQVRKKSDIFSKKNLRDEYNVKSDILEQCD